MGSVTGYRLVTLFAAPDQLPVRKSTAFEWVVVVGRRVPRARTVAVALVAVVGLGVVAATVLGTFVLGIGQSQSTGVGASVGGAQDAGGFERNVERGYLPQPTDLTYEGVVHEHYFDVGGDDCRRRVCPTAGTAVARDPLSNATERYVAVGLDSGVEEFERPPLDVVVVLDTSGSMSEGLGEYAYDGGGDGERATKMAAAQSATVAMLDRLRPGDRVGVVAYDDRARVVQPTRRVGGLDRERLRERVERTSAGGGTDLAAGMDDARDLLAPFAERGDRREQRVIYVTDAMPNVNAGPDGLSGRLESHASQGIHATFVGVGVDFNSRLVETVGAVEGSNYYTVDSPSAFRERMTTGFRYMVTPLAYDLRLDVRAPGYEVTRTYGVPSGDRPSDGLVEVETLFPSRSRDGESEGGVILVGLRRTAPTAGPVTLTASYRRPGGERRSVERTVDLAGERERYSSRDVRKAVLLAQYTDLLRNWAAHERSRLDGDGRGVEAGIEPADDLGRWEQRSRDLVVSRPYRERIERFAAHFRRTTRSIEGEFGDERRLLDQLLAAPAPDDSQGGPSGQEGPPGRE
jgi:Ca-activated chloride channel family protein